jgi:pimeloyl-ACP methyl ester carboxylesterase
MMAGQGYIIAVPDYIGFGESDEVLHPYMHKTSSNAAIVDLLQASRDLLNQPAITTGHNGDLYLMGYSQGGWASLAALDYLEAHPLPGFYPVATACGAGAYNLQDMASYILDLIEYPTPFYMPYFIESRRQNGIMTEDLGIYFQEPYASRIPELFNGNYCNSEINLEFTTHVPSMIQSEMFAHFEDGETFASLRNQLFSSSVQAWNLQSKLHLYHSIGDQSIPHTQTENLYNNFLNLGVSSDMIELTIVQNDTVDHNDAILPWGVEAINWFKAVQKERY